MKISNKTLLGVLEMFDLKYSDVSVLTASKHPHMGSHTWAEMYVLVNGNALLLKEEGNMRELRRKVREEYGKNMPIMGIKQKGYNNPEKFACIFI